jgi:hypothetical protein
MPSQSKRLPASSALSSSALSPVGPPQLADEVQFFREKVGIQNKERQKGKGKNISGFGLNIQQPHDMTVKRHAELYVVYAGQTAVRHPSSLELLSFNPREQVSNWATWTWRRCLDFHGWRERKDYDIIISDLERSAWIGYLLKGSAGPLRVTLPEGDGMTVQVLLKEIPEKQKIIFVLPVKMIERTRGEEDDSDEDLPVLDMSLRLKQDQHRIKRQRSGILKEVAEYETEEGSEESDFEISGPIVERWKERTQNLTQAELETDVEDTIKLENVTSEARTRRKLTKAEQEAKEKAQRAVLDVLAKEGGLRRSERHKESSQRIKD